MNYNDWKEIHEYCMSKPCAYESRPFGEFPICYRLAGRIFAQLTPKEDWFKVTLKTNPDAAYFYRSAYPGVVVRGYHCPPIQQPYWNTIELENFDKEILFQMIDEAYDEVRNHLTKKEQRRLPVLVSLKFVKTDGEDEAFVTLCEELDDYLEQLVGKEEKQPKYDKYNQRNNIHDVIVVYKDEKTIGCGAYKLYDGETIEIKRVYVDESMRGIGVGKELIRRLESYARIAGFRYAVLETDEIMTRAVEFYRKYGYKIIPNYGSHADKSGCVCMSKKL